MEPIIGALIVAAIVATAGSVINGRVTETKLSEIVKRLDKIEASTNGPLALRLQALDAECTALNNRVWSSSLTKDEFAEYRERRHDVDDRISGQLSAMQLEIIKTLAELVRIMSDKR